MEPLNLNAQAQTPDRGPNSMFTPEPCVHQCIDDVNQGAKNSSAYSNDPQDPSERNMQGPIPEQDDVCKDNLAPWSIQATKDKGKECKTSEGDRNISTTGQEDTFDSPEQPTGTDRNTSEDTKVSSQKGAETMSLPSALKTSPSNITKADVQPTSLVDAKQPISGTVPAPIRSVANSQDHPAYAEPEANLGLSTPRRGYLRVRDWPTVVRQSYQAGSSATKLSTVDGSTNPIKTPFLQPCRDYEVPPCTELTLHQAQIYDLLIERIHNVWTSSSYAEEYPFDLGESLSVEERMWLTKECLLRYLRISDWNVYMAFGHLRSTIDWRRAEEVDKHTKFQTSDDRVTAAGGTLAHYPAIYERMSRLSKNGKIVVLGWDVDGRTCLYITPHKHSSYSTDSQWEHFVFMIERAIDLLPPWQEQLTLIVKFEKLGFRFQRFALLARFKKAELSPKFDLPLRKTDFFSRQQMKMLEDYYPGRLGVTLVVKMGGFEGLLSRLYWKRIARKEMSTALRRELKFDPNLSKYVPRDQLPKRYGGKANFKKYEHEVYFPNLVRLAAMRKTEMTQRFKAQDGKIGLSESYLRGEDTYPNMNAPKVPEHKVATSLPSSSGMQRPSRSDFAMTKKKTATRNAQANGDSKPVATTVRSNSDPSSTLSSSTGKSHHFAPIVREALVPVVDSSTDPTVVGSQEPDVNDVQATVPPAAGDASSRRTRLRWPGWVNKMLGRKSSKHIDPEPSGTPSS